MKPALVAALALGAAGCGGSSVCGPPSGTVQAVVDGDTFDLSDGTRVRLLLVDTPEITNGHNDCYGQEAAAFTRGLIEGAVVQLSYDEAACKDRYGRTLAWVTVGGTELNTALVRQGYACSLYIKPGGAARAEEFDTYESEAKTNRTGMWGACTVIPCDK
jgi:micrococcal nuclease